MDAARRCVDDFTLAVSIYYFSSLLVVAGVWFGTEYIERTPYHIEEGSGFHRAFSNWDGVWYTRIAKNSYSYDPNALSSVAFFPAYPVIGRGVAAITGLSEEDALVVVSQGCLIGLLMVVAAYVRARYEEAPDLAAWTILAIAVWPFSFFFRMAYSESLFLLVTATALYGMHRNWPNVVLALIVGFATACRPVGVALLPPYLFYLWRQHKGEPKRLLAKSAFLAPVACWGIIAYMAYLYTAFGDPLVFAKAQDRWVRVADGSWGAQLQSALALEPIWSKYVPGSESYWVKHELRPNPLFCLEFVNPICFVITVGLVAWGGRKGWLNRIELLLAGFLLFVPYITHSHRVMMMSHSRFASAAFPLYLVLGHILCRLPAPFSALIIAILGFLMAAYAALFAAWYRFV